MGKEAATVSKDRRPRTHHPNLNMHLEFSSKIDWWLMVIVLLSTLIAATATYAWARRTRSPAKKILLSSALVAIVGVPAWILMSTNYTLHEEHLDVRSGPFRWNILLNDVHAVSPSSSASASPALSLDRLRIDYGNNRSVLVSPADQEAFSSAIANVAPHVDMTSNPDQQTRHQD